jgi:putative transposase
VENVANAPRRRSWQNQSRSDPHEENEIHCKSDRKHLEGSRSRCFAGRVEPPSRFSKATFDKWKAKYGGIDDSALKRLKELEEENRRLKQMYADLSLEHKALKDIVEKKL